MKAAGLYIHIPFCIRKCGYCSFFSVPFSEHLSSKYVEALLLELDTFQPRKCDTVYIGGGTPTSLSAAVFQKLLEGINRRFSPDDIIEKTVEVNPGTIDPEKLDILLEGGVDRLSMGFQTFDNSFLRMLGRIHTSDESAEAYDMARKAGFTNISVDIIYGIPGQSLKQAEEDVRKVIDLGPEHISCYELSIEPGTAFEEKYGDYPVDEDLSVELSCCINSMLALNGYVHYEVSNFCRPGYESKHNMKYWRSAETLAAGAGAVSYTEGIRIKRTEDIGEYISSVKTGACRELYREHPAGNQLCREVLLMGLRLAEGIDENEFFSLTGRDFSEYSAEIRKFEQERYMDYSENRLKVTEKGWLILNELLMIFFD